MTVSQEFQLSSKIQPKDGISFMEFHPTSPMILGAASWDKVAFKQIVGPSGILDWPDGNWIETCYIYLWNY